MTGGAGRDLPGGPRDRQRGGGATAVRTTLPPQSSVAVWADYRMVLTSPDVRPRSRPPSSKEIDACGAAHRRRAGPHAGLFAAPPCTTLHASWRTTRATSTGGVRMATGCPAFPTPSGRFGREDHGRSWATADRRARGDAAAGQGLFRGDGAAAAFGGRAGPRRAGRLGWPAPGDGHLLIDGVSCRLTGDGFLHEHVPRILLETRVAAHRGGQRHGGGHGRPRGRGLDACGEDWATRTAPTASSRRCGPTRGATTTSTRSTSG